MAEEHFLRRSIDHVRERGPTIEQQGARYGRLIEYDHTSKIFRDPADQRTEDYITGRFG